MQMPKPKGVSLADRAIIGGLFFLVFLLVGVQLAKATEIIPSVGLTRPVDVDDAEAKMFGGLAVRANLMPVLKTELGVAYRSESQSDDLLKIRMWPVTASLWFAPVPMLYAGGGVGWYQITYDYDQDEIAVPIEDETKQEFGVHLGGGLMVPLAPAAGLDLQGRYVMMREQENKLIPSHFDPDFWQASLGLALRF